EGSGDCAARQTDPDAGSEIHVEDVGGIHPDSENRSVGEIEDVRDAKLDRETGSPEHQRRRGHEAKPERKSERTHPVGLAGVPPPSTPWRTGGRLGPNISANIRSEEHTSELQSP